MTLFEFMCAKLELTTRVPQCEPVGIRVPAKRVCWSRYVGTLAWVQAVGLGPVAPHPRRCVILRVLTNRIRVCFSIVLVFPSSPTTWHIF